MVEVRLRICAIFNHLFGGEDVRLELSDDVSWREIVADDIDSSAVVGKSPTNADLTTSFPHNLREMSRLLP